MQDKDTYFYANGAGTCRERPPGAVPRIRWSAPSSSRTGASSGLAYHEKIGEGHAEVNAFRSATEDVAGATIYVTLRPPPISAKHRPCSDKIIEKKIGRVVIAALDRIRWFPDAASRNCRLPASVITGVLAEESSRLNEIFIGCIVEPARRHESSDVPGRKESRPEPANRNGSPDLPPGDACTNCAAPSPASWSVSRPSSWTIRN